MFRRVFLVIMAAVLMLFLAACTMEFDNASSFLSGATKEYRETVELSEKYQKDKPVELNLDMRLAKAEIKGDEEKLADVEFEYSNGALKPEFIVRDDSISIRNNLGKSSFSKPINKWRVGVTDKLPLEVELNSDASSSRLDFSGMLISKLNAQLNASSAKLYFDEPNNKSIDKLRMSANASDVSIYNAGNIGFRVLTLESNASRVLVELTGENRDNSELRIDANASSVSLKLPDDIGVRIVIDKYELSSVKITNKNILSRSDKELVTRDYDKAGRTIKIYVDLNVTTLNIE